jgi:hypothetical protein
MKGSSSPNFLASAMIGIADKEQAFKDMLWVGNALKNGAKIEIRVERLIKIPSDLFIKYPINLS